MGWALRELWWALLVALLVGLVPLGWLLWRWRCRVVDPAELERLRGENQTLAANVEALDRERTELQAAHDTALAAGSQAESQRAELARRDEETQGLRREVERLRADLAAAGRAAASPEGAAPGAGAALAAVAPPPSAAAAGPSSAQLEKLSAQLEERGREAQALRADAEAASRRVLDVETKLAEMTRQTMLADKQVRDQRARIDELEREAFELRSQSERHGRRDARVGELESRLASLQQELAATRRVDDLEEIKGVGPVLVRLLHAEGIYNFWQLATLDPAGIEALDAKLEDFRGRIHRERWVEQARELHAARHGETIG